MAGRLCDPESLWDDFLLIPDKGRAWSTRAAKSESLSPGRIFGAALDEDGGSTAVFDAVVFGRDVERSAEVFGSSRFLFLLLLFPPLLSLSFSFFLSPDDVVASFF